MNYTQKRIADLEERHVGDRAELAKLRARLTRVEAALSTLDTLAREMMTDEGHEHEAGVGMQRAVAAVRAVLEDRPASSGR